MKKKIQLFLIVIVRKLAPIFRFIAFHSNIKVNYPWTAQGRYPLVFLDKTGKYKNQIPHTVTFNTMSGSITIGENTVFGEDVMVLTGKHYFISEVEIEEDLHGVPEGGRDIVIGKNGYIGSCAIIVGPVEIGDYAVICAGAVVTKDVPAMTMYGGVPAKKN